MDRVKKLDVFYHDRLVGTMALYNGTLCAFEYSKEWLIEGFSISPFSLPLEKGVFMPKIDPFEGLFGVFAIECIWFPPQACWRHLIEPQIWITIYSCG